MTAKHILVLCGGKSTEREVSLASGKAVAGALEEAGFRVTVFDPKERNVSEIPSLNVDCAFIALHGIGGEDGAIQGLLEWMNVPYTGPGIAASALCLDKIMTKKVLTLSGVPTPDFLEFDEKKLRDLEKCGKEALEKLGLPVVLKASRQGSSIGTVIVRKEEDLTEALRELCGYGDHILAEVYLSGMELTVPVMGNSEAVTLPVIEITADGEYYDYHSKYTPGKSRHIIPAGIDKELTEKVEKIAKKAYLATGCRGFSRVDVMLDGKGEPYVIEINTVPGMTGTSLFPDAAKAVGMSFTDLVTKIVDLALN